MSFLKNTSGQLLTCSVIKLADGSRYTSLTGVTVRIKKDAGAYANGGGTLALVETDKFEYPFTQAETNADQIQLIIDHADAVQPAVYSIYPVPNEAPTAAAVVDEWETQANSDPTGFKVNVMEVNGTAQTANDVGADVDAILEDTATTIPATLATAQTDLDTITGADGVNLLSGTQTQITTIAADTTTDIPATITALQSNITDILIDTGTTIPATITTAQADLDTITGVDGVNLLSATQTTIDAIPTSTNSRILANRELIVASGGFGNPGIDIILEIKDSSGTPVAADATPTFTWKSVDGTNIFGSPGVISNETVGEYSILRSGTTGLITPSDIIVTATWEVSGIEETLEHVYYQTNHNSQSISAQVSDVLVDTSTNIPATITTAQADLDIITGADGVNLLSGTQATLDALPTATQVVDEWETQSQADPTGFHVNMIEVGGVLQTPNNMSGDINGILTDTSSTLQLMITDILVDTATTIPAAIATAQADLDTITGVDGVNLLSGTQATIDTIEADTNELQTDWVDAGRLDTLLDTAAAGGVLTATAIADAVWEEPKADHVGTTTFGDLATDLDTVVSDSGRTDQELADAVALTVPTGKSNNLFTEVGNTYSGGALSNVPVPEQFTILVPPRGTTANLVTTTPLYIQPSEKVMVAVDYTAIMSEGDYLASIDATTEVDGKSIVLEAVGTTEKLAKLWVSGIIIAEMYRVSVTVTTHFGLSMEADFNVFAGN